MPGRNGREVEALGSRQGLRFRPACPSACSCPSPERRRGLLHADQPARARGPALDRPVLRFRVSIEGQTPIRPPGRVQSAAGLASSRTRIRSRARLGKPERIGGGVQRLRGLSFGHAQRPISVRGGDLFGRREVGCASSGAGKWHRSVPRGEGRAAGPSDRTLPPKGLTKRSRCANLGVATHLIRRCFGGCYSVSEPWRFPTPGLCAFQEVLRGGFLLLIAHEVPDRLAHNLLLIQPALLDVIVKHRGGFSVDETNQCAARLWRCGLRRLPQRVLWQGSAYRLAS